MDLGLYIPQIKSKGRYEVNGQVLLLPILSHGEFFAEFSKKKELGVVHKFDLHTDGWWNVDSPLFLFTADINAIAKMYGKQIIKNNEAYMTVEKMVVDFVMKGARFKVKDQGHQQLSKIFIQNNFIWRELT